MNKQRIKKIQSHIQKGDYFGTLATILDLMCQNTKCDLEVDKKIKSKNLELLQSLRDDLIYLHGNYKIIKK